MAPTASRRAPGGDRRGVHAVEERPEGVQAAPGGLAHRLPLLGPFAVARDEAAAYLGVPLIGVDVDATNQGWLCDKGRFGFEYMRSPARLAAPLVRGADGELHEADWAEALDAAAAGIRKVIAEQGPQAVAGLGGARSTNEEAYAFAKLLRGVIGTGNLDASMGDDPGAALLVGTPRRATIDDLERAKTILVWGPDLKEELPVLHLRVRRAATGLRPAARCARRHDHVDRGVREHPSQA